MNTQQVQQSAPGEWAVVRLGLMNGSALVLDTHPTRREALDHARERNFRTLTNPHLFYLVLPLGHPGLANGQGGAQL